MITLLDDPSPLVRRALADALAPFEDAPHTVIVGLLQDQAEIAAIVARHSPLLLDAELVDLVGAGAPLVQYAVARRDHVPRPLPPPSPRSAASRPALPSSHSTRSTCRPSPSTASSSASATMPTSARRCSPAPTCRPVPDSARGEAVRRALRLRRRSRLAASGRAQRIAREASDKATVAIAATCGGEGIAPLVRHLRQSGQLSTGLVLRALLSGNVRLFEQALAELSGLSLRQASGLVHDRRGAGFRALYDRAGLPSSTYPAFRARLTPGTRTVCRSSAVATPSCAAAWWSVCSRPTHRLPTATRRAARPASPLRGRGCPRRGACLRRDLVAGHEALDDEAVEFPLVAAA